MLSQMAFWLDARFEAAANPRRQRAIFQSLQVNSLGTLGILIIPLMARGREDFSWIVYGLAASSTVALQLGTMMAILLHYNERFADTTMGRFGVYSTLGCTALYMAVSPSMSPVLAPMFACCYAWGIFRFRASDFIRFGLLTVGLFLCSSYAAKYWHHGQAVFTDSDWTAAASLALVLVYIGVLGSWMQRIRGAHRKLNKQLLTLDQERVLNTHAESQLEPNQFLQRLRDEITLVGIGKPAFCLVVLRIDEIAMIETRYGQASRLALTQHVCALAWTGYTHPEAISQLPDGALAILLTQTTAKLARHASAQIEHRLNRSIVALPGTFEPLSINIQIHVISHRNGESAKRLIHRALAVATETARTRESANKAVNRPASRW
jgi:GGDEF domain-containing protein